MVEDVNRQESKYLNEETTGEREDCIHVLKLYENKLQDTFSWRSLSLQKTKLIKEYECFFYSLLALFLIIVL